MDISRLGLSEAADHVEECEVASCELELSERE